MENVYNFLDKLLKNNDSLVIGVSGGPDSMCLLNILISYKDKLNLKIICAHVNHGLRKESEEEAEFVKDFCQKNNIIFEYLKINKYTKNKFSEEEARKKRYSFFDELIEKYRANYLMTAHHGNDLEETILMRLVRGSNLKGYIGIPLISENTQYKIIRPLLFLNKKGIIEYLNKNNINYVEDLSNDSLKYTRNRFRKLKFLKYSKELQDYHNYICRIIDPIIENNYKNNRINIEYLKKEDEFIQRKIIERIIELIQKDEILNISDKQLDNILKLIKNSKNRIINLSDNFIARVSYNYLYIEKNINDCDYLYEFDKSITILDKYRIEEISNTNDKSNNVIRLNKKEISLPLMIRPFKKGDKIKVKNLNGTKKVSDIFINSKLDLKKRKEYPLLVDSQNNVIWIPGIKKSTFDKEILEKYDIILKYTEEKDEQRK